MPETACTLYRKIVDQHTVKKIDDRTVLLFCDIHFANEYTSPQAFAGLRERGLPVFAPDAHLCVVDHIIPTHDESPRRIIDEASLIQAQTLEKNCQDFGIRAFYGADNPNQGIEHVVIEEQGLVRPGMVVICGRASSAGHGCYLRRQPHDHARSFRSLGFWHRHNRNRAYFGHIDTRLSFSQNNAHYH